MSKNKQAQFQNNKKMYSQKINNYNKMKKKKKIISNKQYHASNEHSLKTARKNRIKKILILNKTNNINKLNQTNNLLLLDASLVTIAFESNSLLESVEHNAFHSIESPEKLVFLFVKILHHKFW